MNINFTNALHQSGLSTYRLSKQSGVPYTVVHELVSGKKDINKRPAETVSRLAAVLGLSSEEIMNPIYYMDKVSGKYRGVSYEWKHDGEMKLLLKNKDFSSTLESKYNMTRQKDKKAYDAYTEICIDQTLAELDAKNAIERFLQKEKADGNL
ncbi:MAG: helix-turn-helix domain-containing protein [Eubacterium sp.]|nr:helix-turn-helix domain-containing protein [Eubacterium sp.]